MGNGSIPVTIREGKLNDAISIVNERLNKDSVNINQTMNSETYNLSFGFLLLNTKGKR